MLVTAAVIVLVVVICLWVWSLTVAASRQPAGSVCRDCCRPILWTVGEEGPVAIDPKPRPDGNLELHHVGLAERLYTSPITTSRRAELKLAAAAAARAGDTLPLNLYVQHTCPGGNR